MSSIKLESNASGTGIFTIASPNSNTNRTLTLPDNAGTVATQEYIPTALNASGSAPIYAARAWVNFNGTSTVAIRASGNVTSITDGGTGVYTINFTTAISDGNYDFNASCYSGSGGEGDVIWTSSSGTLGTTGLAIVCGVPGTAGSTGYTVRDNAVICVSIFR